MRQFLLPVLGLLLRGVVLTVAVALRVDDVQSVPLAPALASGGPAQVGLAVFRCVPKVLDLHTRFAHTGYGTGETRLDSHGRVRCRWPVV